MQGKSNVMIKKDVKLNRFIVDRLNSNETIDSEQLKNQFVSLYHHHNDLTASLKYAEIIQKGVLPKDRHFQRLFNDYFVMYVPQSYVSGDFYWIGEVDDKIIFAVGDCTGHGVPGAMLTMLAQSFLNYIILGKGITNTSEILKEFDKKLIETFMHEKEGFYSNDWIDMALCCFDKSQMEIDFSSAKRKLMLVSKTKSQIYKGSNYPLGGWQLEKERTFESKKIQVKDGDMIFIGSDGFQDQIGGEQNKKYGSKQLHFLLENIASLPCDKQLLILKRTFLQWKKEERQLDDICLMGIRV